MNKNMVFTGVILCLTFWTGIAAGQEDSAVWREHDHDRWIRFMSHRNPTLGLSYGWTQSSLDGSTQSLYNPRSAEVRLGGLFHRDSDESEEVVEQKNDYLFLGVSTKDLGGEAEQGEILYTAWRFGGGWENGYGYELAGSPEGPSINLLTSQGVQLTNFRLKGGITNGADSLLLGMYESGLRFGTRSGGVLRFHIIPLLAVDAGYERSVIYRRHKFWEWLGSVIVEGGGTWALDRFVDRVLRSTPEAVPILNFVLKTALAYGVYELRMKNGNWPFESEAPISNSTFMVGVTMVF